MSWDVEYDHRGNTCLIVRCLGWEGGLLFAGGKRNIAIRSQGLTWWERFAVEGGGCISWSSLGALGGGGNWCNYLRAVSKILPFFHRGSLGGDSQLEGAFLARQWAHWAGVGIAAIACEW